MADFVNARIGNYLIQSRIGTGGMARVYRAWDEAKSRHVAIKILHDHWAEDATFKDRFEQEAQLVSAFDHPNIVRVYDFGVTTRDGLVLPYMVMACIEGKTLREELQTLASAGETLPLNRALAIARDLCSALGYAHERGMVHADVKPGNVMIADTGEAILMDFGIARVLAGTQGTQEVFAGTPAYISPEQAFGLPVDGRSDLYALGILLYEMIAGQPPYTGDSSLAVMLKHLNDPIPDISAQLPEPNPTLERIIQRALAKNADERYQTADEMAGDLRLALGEDQPTAVAPNRRRWLLALPALALIAAAVFFITRPPAGDPTRALSATPFASTFDSDDPTRANWPQGVIGGLHQEIADGVYRLGIEPPNSAITSIFNPDFTYGDATITLTGTIETGSDPTTALGIIARYLDNDHYYAFAVDGQGRFRLWILDAGRRALPSVEEQWSPHDAVRPPGEPNTLRLTLNGATLAAFVNDVQVRVLNDETFASGNVGIYLSKSREGRTSAEIDSFEVAPVSTPAP